MTIQFNKRAHLPPAARERNFPGIMRGGGGEGVDGLAKPFRGKEQRHPASPTNHPYKIHKVGEDPGDFLPKYPSIASYCIPSLWITAFCFLLPEQPQCP